MDIDLLSKMVKELILDNDRVVLPGLGSFVAEIVPSTFSDRGYTINPPYRRLFFRSRPDEGDMLAKFYAESNNVQPEIAERIINDFIAELKNVLHTRKTVVFPGLGRLRATKENNIFFVADEDLDIYPAGFGLEPISLKTHVETPQEVAAVVEGLKEIIDEPVEEIAEEKIDETVVQMAEEKIEEPADEAIDIALEEDIVPTEWTEAVAQEEQVETTEPSDTAEQSIEPVEPVLQAEPIESTELVESTEPVETADPVETSGPVETAEPVDDCAEGHPVEGHPVEEQPVSDEYPSESEDKVESESKAESEGMPDSVAETEPVPESLPELEASPETAPLPLPILDLPEESDCEKQKAPLSNRILLGVVIALASLVVLVVIYIVVMRVFPDFLNGLLYSPEELEIINFK